MFYRTLLSDYGDNVNKIALNVNHFGDEKYLYIIRVQME